jgi:hypothetical protein
MYWTEEEEAVNEELNGPDELAEEEPAFHWHQPVDVVLVYGTLWL